MNLPDGRRLRVRFEESTGCWMADVEGAESSRSTSGRWLLMVLSDALGLPEGRKPQWVLELVEEITGTDTPIGRRFACPCCEHLTLTEPPTGTFAICPVCRWEDDNVQFLDPDRAGGANRVSLGQARRNFRRVGVSDPQRQEHARAPRSEEVPPRPAAQA
jgi:Cysteine-rich CPCC